MAKEDPAPKNPLNESVPVGPNPAEARTETTDANKAANTYATQAEEAKGTQDPYPFDPTNELLDGDDSPSQSELAARGVRVSDSGRALVPEDDPTGAYSIPPPNSNLEIMKSREKVMVAADEADGVDPEIGRRARAGARAEAAQARRGAQVNAAGGDEEQARGASPRNRTTEPKSKT